MVEEKLFREVLDKAIDAKSLSYSPYSHFAVGAALLAEDNTIIVGANVENASYGGAICAERTALVKAITSGHKKFKMLAVSTNSKTCSSPCGICRQFIREFAGPELDLPIVMLNVKGEYVSKTIGELLPLSFGPEDLNQ